MHGQQFQSQMKKTQWEQDGCTGRVPGHLVSLGLCVLVSAAKVCVTFDTLRQGSMSVPGFVIQHECWCSSNVQ